MRAVWDDESAGWWFCAMDIAEALTKSKNLRKYWNTLKTRKPELSSICRQLKLKVNDRKHYNTDVVDESGLNTVLALFPSKKADVFSRWIDYSYYYETGDSLSKGKSSCLPDICQVSMSPFGYICFADQDHRRQ